MLSFSLVMQYGDLFSLLIEAIRLLVVPRSIPITAVLLDTVPDVKLMEILAMLQRYLLNIE